MFGNHPVSLPGTEPRSPPPAFASDPLMHASADGKDVASTRTGYTNPAHLEIVEIDGPASATSSLSNHEHSFMKNTSPTAVRIILYFFYFLF